MTTEYDKCIAALFQRHPSVQKDGFTAGAYKPGMDAMRQFDERIGRPSERLRCIHVAGTNGKGSVCSMLAAALSGAGYRVGLYTSPHILDFRERMKIIEKGTWRMVPKEYVWDFLHSGAVTDSLSFFEITTGMAFKWFKDEEVDIAVIEVGLGGRLDSTNIITPELSIVTSIGLDHCALLGGTRALIAAEKAGIFKPGVPALVWGRDDETEDVFEKIAAERHCPIFFAEDFDEELFDTDLTGPYQPLNLRTVLAALELLGEVPDREAIAHTAATTAFHGRWERLLDNPETICDIGHNPAALRINFSGLKDLGRPLFIVYGIMADKDLAGIRPMMPEDARYFLVAPKTSRALPVEALSKAMDGLGFTVEQSVAQGVKSAIEEATKTPGALIYIGGSTFVVSEAMEFLDKN